MIRILIIGAAGRMGRRLVSLTAEAPDLTLTGAIEYSGCPLLGEDAGTVAGGASLGVALTDEIAAAVADTDVTIDFSTAATVLANARTAVAADCGVVIGTTAMPAADRESLRQLAETGRIVFAPNMSVGVNLLFKLCAEAASILDEDYDIEIVEMHHNQKKDAPSGTAERLGEILAETRDLDYRSDTRHGREGMAGARTKREIGMHALRGGDVVGDHTVIFATGGERLELTHKAGSRDTFARGALRAARFLMTAEPGLYDMQAVLGLDNT